jgi:hypothetical protein
LVIVGFDRKVDWVEFSAETGIELAEAILTRAQQFLISVPLKMPIGINVEADRARKKVIIAMTQPMDWLEFNASDAVEFANAIARMTIKAAEGQPPADVSLILPR